ncbi:hypothetical protein ES705_35916 [subsurface metagenome]
MKNRKLLYILIPASVIIWGAIAINIINNLRRSTDYKQENYLPFSESSSDSVEEGYTLIADYPDPFRPQYTSSPVSIAQKNEKTQVRNTRTDRRNPIQRRRIVWPNIEYLGVIINEDQRVALLKIDNSNTIMQAGDVSRQIKLKKMYNDSVQLIYQGEEKVYHKKTPR